MRNFLLAFTVFLLWSTLALWYVFSNVSLLDLKTFFQKEQPASEKPNVGEANEVIGDSLSNEFVLFANDKTIDSTIAYVFDENNIRLFGLDSVAIKKNNDSVFFSSAPEVYFTELVAYLNDNPKQELIIFSDYSASENFSTPNFGLKRGEFTRNELIKVGISREKTSIKSLIKNFDFPENGLHYGGLSFHLKSLTAERQEEIEKNKSLSKNIYPTFTFSSIVANKELQDYAKELKEYLEFNPEKKVGIIGHTDNIGSKIDNYEMGLKYAQQVRRFLINNGIAPERITASSQGELNPIDINTTKAGRDKNRRIEFIIQ